NSTQRKPRPRCSLCSELARWLAVISNGRKTWPVTNTSRCFPTLRGGTVLAQIKRLSVNRFYLIATNTSRSEFCRSGSRPGRVHMVVIGEFLDPPEQVDAITPLGKNEAAELSRN